MKQPATNSFSSPSDERASSRARPRAPFFGLLDPVIIEDGLGPTYAGGLTRSEAGAAWTFLSRDVASDLIDPRLPDGDSARALLEAALPEVLKRTYKLLDGAARESENERRLRSAMGGDANWRRLPVVLTALKSQALLEKAVVFGRAANSLAEEALAMALQSIPRQDQSVAALLMQAAVGQIHQPGRLLAAVVRVAGGPSELAVERAGFAPAVEATLAHAHNQLPAMMQWGTFVDIDLTCRSLERFHRLHRAVTGFLDLSRLGRWATIVSNLTAAASEKIEPQLRSVAPDVSRALRRPREGVDRADSEQLLHALNGVYLLSTVRECRESLAVNALFDQTWVQVGAVLEQQLERNLDLLRSDPRAEPVQQRIEASIKMAEVRFGTEYADMMRRSYDTIAARRLAKAG